MQIKADKEGAEAIRGLCDCALKTAGLANLPIVTNVLANLDHPDKPRPKPVPEKPDEDKKE